MNKNSSPKT